MRIVIVNGPNLNLVGKREPSLYGNMPMDKYIEELRNSFADIDLDYMQSNHEGDLIDKLQAEGFSADGIVLNAGGYTHTSVALRDTVAAISTPVVEVHITDISKREPFRRISLLTDVCKKTITGKGLEGYREAIMYLIDKATKAREVQ